MEKTKEEIYNKWSFKALSISKDLCLEAMEEYGNQRFKEGQESVKVNEEQIIDAYMKEVGDMYPKQGPVKL